MNCIEFTKEFERVINLIASEIEKNDIAGDIDVDMNGDILSLIIQRGVFIINKQSFTKEIWLSSPISGPYHFLYNGKVWESSAGNTLFKVLSDDLKIEIEDPL